MLYVVPCWVESRCAVHGKHQLTVLRCWGYRVHGLVKDVTPGTKHLAGDPVSSVFVSAEGCEADKTYAALCLKFTAEIGSLRC